MRQVTDSSLLGAVHTYNNYWFSRLIGGKFSIQKRFICTLHTSQNKISSGKNQQIRRTNDGFSYIDSNRVGRVAFVVRRIL